MVPSDKRKADDGVPATTLEASEGPTQAKKAKRSKRTVNRCGKCNIKVGVMGFPCRCGGSFCTVHRYADEHDCPFDYKEAGQEEIRKNNPQVIGEKIQKL